jgi:hypothetical protein
MPGSQPTDRSRSCVRTLASALLGLPSALRPESPHSNSPASIRAYRPIATGSLASFALAALLTLSACSSLKVGLGMRVDLTKIPVASMEANLPKGPAIAPGQKSPLVVEVTQTDGKVLVTEGAGHGKVQWEDLKLTTSIVTANQKGILALRGDPRISEGKVGHVSVVIPSQPNVHSAELDVPFRYDVAFVSNFSGSPGANGMDGTNGMDGSNGTSGSIDPNNPSPGGNGGDGSNGSDGGNGGDGGNAPAVDVLVALQPSAHPLLQMSVSANGKRKYYLVDPQGGSLTIKADGGRGGFAGKGGRGGRGGSGGSGTPSGNSGSDGRSGQDGFAGRSGRGGLITVTYDPQASAYVSIIHASSVNLRQAAVAPLW